MRSTCRITALILVLVALVAPLTIFASGGPCPDDPALSASCNQTAPPYYVVVNRAEQHLTDRPGTGCQPWILKHPECTVVGTPQCDAINVEAEVCGPMLSQRRPNADGSDPIIYEMLCDCTNPNGTWYFRIRLWHADGTCPLDPDNAQWVNRLPPGTGIDLPTPLIVGGLALLGVALVAAGLLVRRRSMQTA